MPVSIVGEETSLVATRVGVIVLSSSTKPYSGIALMTVVYIVSNDADSYSGMGSVSSHDIEPFVVTAGLQGALRTNQRFPRVTT